MLVVLPALVLVFAAGFVIGGVRAPVGAWLASLALMWLALIPMTILGIVVGLWVKGDAVQGLTTLLLLVLSMLGGLWFPVQIMPQRDADHRAHLAVLLAGGARSVVVPAGCGLPVGRRGRPVGVVDRADRPGRPGLSSGHGGQQALMPGSGGAGMASAALSRFLRPAGFDAHEDPQAAPGVHHGADSAKPWTLRRGLQNRLWLYLCGLVFLVFAIGSIWEGDPSRAVVIARSVAIGVIAVAYVLTAWMVDMSIRARWVYVGGFFALLAATSTVWGWSFVYYGVYVTIVIAALIPWRIARLMIVGWGVLLVMIAAVIPAWTPVYIALIAVAMGLAMGSGLESGRVGAQLARAQQRVSTLAVAAERERISRDLHDILGHSLTAISIKSELAGRLVDVESRRRQGADRRGGGDRPAGPGRRPRHGVGDPGGPGRRRGRQGSISPAGGRHRGSGAVGATAADRPDQRAVRLRGPRGRHQCGPAQRRHRAAPSR